jgi:uncharacterized protein DUF4276
VRVVLYAEGGRDRGSSSQVAPREPLPDEALGPAHILVRRCLLEAVSDLIVTFEAPKRHRAGRSAKGSDLRSSKLLRQLITFAINRPDLVVVLIDADGEGRRRLRSLEAIVEQCKRPHPVVVGVPVQEFEAWLVADQSSVHEVVGHHYDSLVEPESLAPTEAKEWLDRVTSRSYSEVHEKRKAHRGIAAACDLDRLAGRCRAFERFRKKLHLARDEVS